MPPWSEKSDTNAEKAGSMCFIKRNSTGQTQGNMREEGKKIVELQNKQVHKTKTNPRNI